MADIKHLDAFELFYSMGPKRSYVKCAEQLGVKYKTLERWANVEKWREEAKLRDSEVIKANREQLRKDKAAKFEDLQTVADSGLALFIDKLQKGKVKCETIKDLKSIVEIYEIIYKNIDDSYFGAIKEAEEIIEKREKEKLEKENETDGKIELSFSVKGEPIDEDKS